MANDDEKALAKVIQARTDLVLTEPFFGRLALNLAPIPTMAIKRFATDGKRLLFNPQYVESISSAEVKGVICHEVMHCANGHPWRQGWRDHKEWNEACDYAINPIVLGAGMELLDCRIDEQFNGWSAERIADFRRQQQEQLEQERGEKGDKSDEDNDEDTDENDGDSDNSDSGDDDPSNFGEVMKPQESESETKELQQKWREDTLVAAQVAKGQGKLPGALDRLINEIKNPTVDEFAALKRFLQQSAKNDYTWSRPSRRYAGAGLYLPSLKSESFPAIALAIDTSGSIDEKQLERFVGKLNGIVQELQPEKVTVIYCDDEIQGEPVIFERGEDVKVEAKGGGGTSFIPVFDWLTDQDEPFACVVYFTDLMGEFPATEPDLPTLWAVTDEDSVRVPPFGEVIKLKGE